MFCATSFVVPQLAAAVPVTHAIASARIAGLHAANATWIGHPRRGAWIRRAGRYVDARALGLGRRAEFALALAFAVTANPIHAEEPCAALAVCRAVLAFAPQAAASVAADIPRRAISVVFADL